jgi:uncharacterized Tic20 family protein
MKSEPSTEERVWAVLSHLSALAFGMGILLPVIAWSEQRRKSNYAAFQSLQALGYQSIGYTFWILASLVIIIIQSVFTVRELASAYASGEDPTGFLGSVMSAHFGVMIGLIGLYLLPPVMAAAAAAMGRDFRYPLMGDRLARYLGYDRTKTSNEQDWLIEDHEDRWVAAMGHFAVIIALWGMLAPLVAWMLQGKRSPFLRFQSIQTFLYQAGVILLSFAALLIYLFGSVLSLGSIGFMGEEGFRSPSAVFGIIVLVITLLLVIALLLIIPLFHIQGQWAGYRVLKGDNYYYPVVGKLVHRTLSKRET